MEQEFAREQRWNNLAAEYQAMLYRVAFANMHNRADAEDVMQESLLKLYTEAKDFESADHEKHWLLRVAANECKKLLRSPWRRRTDPLDEAAEAAAFDRPAQSELFRQVMALPPKYRAAIYLHYYEGYTAAETGEILGVPTTTVHTRLARGRAKLKALIGGMDYEQSV